VAPDLRYLLLHPAPIALFSQIILVGLSFSLLDVGRRVAVEELLKKEEADHLNKQLRKDESHYDL
jgi:hypothetical protein